MKTKQKVKISIPAPNFQILTARMEGTSPLMVHRFSEKMRRQMEEKQTSKDTVQKKREPKDYEEEYQQAKYISTEGWEGFPCAAVRASMIAACRHFDGLTMKMAKGSFFIKAEGYEQNDGTSLVRIHGTAQHDTRPVRIGNGTPDLRNRPLYKTWYAEVSIQYDADAMTAQDVANLLARAGAQVGICELRPQAAVGTGGDYGLWSVRTREEKKVKKAK